MKDIKLIDYLNNSGTRGSEPFYKEGSSIKVSHYKFIRKKDGRYLKVNIKPIQYKTIIIEY